MSFCAYFGALVVLTTIAMAAALDAAAPANRNLNLTETSTSTISSTEATTIATAIAIDSNTSSTKLIEVTAKSPMAQSQSTRSTNGENQTKIEKPTYEPSTTQIADVITSVSDDMVTIDTGTIAFSEDADANSEQPESETVSFGIRSFTVEVTTATDKPTVEEHHNVAAVASSQPTEIPSPKTTAAAAAAGSSRSSEEVTANSGITIVPIKMSSSDSSSSSAAPSPSPSPTPTIMKQENGLYRIKIAEIITDEFNSGMRDDDGNDENLNQIQNQVPPAMLMNRYRAQQAAAVASKQGRINIADLYPSKIEDFEPIIRESNEKMLQQKNRFALNSDDDAIRFNDEIVNDDGNRQQNSIQLNYDAAAAPTQIEGKVNFIENNIPTTKIEIELIDEPGASKDDVKIIGPSDDDDDVEQDVEISSIDASVVGPDDSDGDGADKITDFTSKLQENDGIISTIERSFLKVANNENVENDKTPITVNKAINAMGFIERRVKKHDPMFKNRFALNEESRKLRSDIGNTKFNGGADSMADNTIAPADNRKPELSTTKFYNGRAVHNDGVAKQMKATAATVAATNHAQSVDRKILFFNVNGNRTNAKEMERLKHDREEIIKGKSVVANESGAANESSNMHLYVMHTNTARPAASPSTDNPNEKPASLASTAMPTTTTSKVSTSSAQPTTNNNNNMRSASITSASSAANTISSSTENNSPSPPLSSTAWAAMPNAETEAALIRSQKLKRLRDRLDSLECDMQTMMPDESTVWRGNETHELSLPTTVSSHILYKFSCMPNVVRTPLDEGWFSSAPVIIQFEYRLLIKSHEHIARANDKSVI